jgi:hypothetical protein
VQWFRLRPTFEIELADSREQVISKLESAHRMAEHRDHFLLYGEYGELHLPPAEHRLWSPHLSFYVMERGNDSVIHGRFAPRPDIWTVVWIAYLLAAFSAFFAAMFSASQWQVNERAWGLWLLLISIAIFCTIYIVAHFGQQWSADQMQALRNRLESILASAGIQ